MAFVLASFLVQLIPNVLQTIFVILSDAFNFDQSEMQNNSI